MLDGDAFAKKFGGESGNDPDFFNLIIHSYLDGELSEDSIVVKLADYTFEDNSQDYILNSWLDVDLSVLGMADSLSFQLNSSDIGDFGMNTPAYFCLDNLVYSTINSVENQTDSKFIVYPNPANSQLFTRTPFDKVMAFNCLGEMVLEFSNEKEMAELDISSLSKGLYSFQFFRKDKFEIAQVIVN